MTSSIHVIFCVTIESL